MGMIRWMLGSGTPAEPEQADRDEERAHAGGGGSRASGEVDGSPLPSNFGSRRLVHPPVVWRDDDHCSDEDADVCEALLAPVEVVYISRKTIAEGLEPDVDEGDVYRSRKKTIGYREVQDETV